MTVRSFWQHGKKINSLWFKEMVSQAVKKGDIAIWRLLGGKAKSFRPLVMDGGEILTDPDLIMEELKKFHEKSLTENTIILPGDFEPVVWIKIL